MPPSDDSLYSLSVLLHVYPWWVFCFKLCDFAVNYLIAALPRCNRMQMKENTILGPGGFLDRDGTINESRGYITRVDDFALLPHSAEAIKLFNRLGLKTVVVTNQSGVARELLTEERLREINGYMGKQLQKEGARLNGIYYCPHHPLYGDENYRKDCFCRKPNPGMVFRAAAYFLINPKISYVVGDKEEDMELASRVEAKAILVLTGMGQETLQRGVKPSWVATHLLDAARWIENDLKTVLRENP